MTTDKPTVTREMIESVTYQAHTGRGPGSSDAYVQAVRDAALAGLRVPELEAKLAEVTRERDDAIFRMHERENCLAQVDVDNVELQAKLAEAQKLAAANERLLEDVVETIAKSIRRLYESASTMSVTPSERREARVHAYRMAMGSVVESIRWHALDEDLVKVVEAMFISSLDTQSQDPKDGRDDTLADLRKQLRLAEDCEMVEITEAVRRMRDNLDGADRAATRWHECFVDARAKLAAAEADAKRVVVKELTRIHDAMPSIATAWEGDQLWWEWVQLYLHKHIAALTAPAEPETTNQGDEDGLQVREVRQESGRLHTDLSREKDPIRVHEVVMQRGTLGDDRGSRQEGVAEDARTTQPNRGEPKRVTATAEPAKLNFCSEHRAPVEGCPRCAAPAKLEPVNHDEGRVCMLCGKAVPSGARYEHGIGVCAEPAKPEPVPPPATADQGSWFEPNHHTMNVCAIRRKSDGYWWECNSEHGAGWSDKRIRQAWTPRGAEREIKQHLADQDVEIVQLMPDPVDTARAEGDRVLRAFRSSVARVRDSNELNFDEEVLDELCRRQLEGK